MSVGVKKYYLNLTSFIHSSVIHTKKAREESREYHNRNHSTPPATPLPDTKRKREPTNPNKHKPNKRTKSTKISSLFPKRGNRNAKRTEKHMNKMKQDKTKKIAQYNKSQSNKATNTKTNTGTSKAKT